MKRPRLENKPPCPRCGSFSVVGHTINLAGGRRFQCRGCGRGFVHGGPGINETPGAVAAEFVRLVFDCGRSIRAACRDVGIAKGTGRRIYWKIRAKRMMELS